MCIQAEDIWIIFDMCTDGRCMYNLPRGGGGRYMNNLTLCVHVRAGGRCMDNLTVCVCACRWKHPSCPRREVGVTLAILTTMKRSPCASPPQRSVPKNLPTFETPHAPRRQ